MLLEYVGQQWATLEAEVWNMIAAFSLGKKVDSGWTAKIEQIRKNTRIQKEKQNFNENRLNPFFLQDKDPGHTLERILFPNEPVQNAYFSTTWPIVFKT